MKSSSLKQELGFAVAGITGVTLYFICENVALTYTNASNVGVIVSIAPMFTALLAAVFQKNERPGAGFFMGFLVAIIGIALISFNGTFVLNLSPIGDLLTIGAAFSWAIYSIVIAKVGKGLDTILCTRRVFFWGVVFMIPALFFFDFNLDLKRFLVLDNIVNMAFLGIVASALCYIFWNRAIKTLGAVKTNAYIYLTPAVSIVASAILINEKITWMAIIGAVLTLLGLWFSQQFSKRRRG